VTRLAERLRVGFGIGAAFGERHQMVGNGGDRDTASLEAQDTQRLLVEQPGASGL
jgi:hypothetical protein